jgi:hypothetical protein
VECVRLGQKIARALCDLEPLVDESLSPVDVAERQGGIGDDAERAYEYDVVSQPAKYS